MNNESVKYSSCYFYQLAEKYGVGTKVFEGWLRVENEAFKTIEPYLEKRVIIPTKIINDIVKIFGNPIEQKRFSIFYIAQMYNVSRSSFNQWLQVNSKAKELIDRYHSKNVYILPVSIVKQLIEIFGEP